MQKVEIENYKNHGIWISDNEYSIFWFRGKKHFSYAEPRKQRYRKPSYIDVRAWEK